MQFRKVASILFALMGFAAFYWAFSPSKSPREVSNPLPFDLPPGVLEPASPDFRETVRRQAVEYVTLYIVPGLPRPDSGKVPAEKVASELDISGRHWETSGVMEHVLPDGTTRQSLWEVLIRYDNGQFAPVAVIFDGQEIPLPDSVRARRTSVDDEDVSD